MTQPASYVASSSSQPDNVIETIDKEEEEEESLGCADYLKNGEFSQMAHSVAQTAEEFIRHVWMRGWQVVNHGSLPLWLKDNDFLLRGHRPQLNTFKACFNSIFRIHTETGNIWTHLLGCATFIAILIGHLSHPAEYSHWQDKLVDSAFYLGAILCLGFSWLFHTVYCHSETIGRLFNKLDYAGIAVLTIGSFVPFNYYLFYCSLWAKIFYTSLIIILGTLAICVSMFDKFATAKYRAFRAAVFVMLGLSAVIPVSHFLIVHPSTEIFFKSGLPWFLLMAFFYISGAVIYATRVPERIFPGRFDIWFQSHQIFHVFVVIAAILHFHGIMVLSNWRFRDGDCKIYFYEDVYSNLQYKGQDVNHVADYVARIVEDYKK